MLSNLRIFKEMFKSQGSFCKLLCVLCVQFLVSISLLMLTVRVLGLGDADAEEKPRTLCGRILADARVFYCYSSDGRKRSYDAPRSVSMHRLSVVFPWLARIYQHEHEQDELVQQLEQQKHRQHALALRGKREAGLVDECCLKPCYINELLNYC
ncbi:hypothetical protein O0L34_g2521 [Tuta absoluta]|nr:hypothetical protein O0L34_g2521 [Tuta absoluta]